MAWGILNDPRMEYPPGTVNLAASSKIDELENATVEIPLKKRGDVTLQPQPSDSPNDPLNWSKLWKFSGVLVITLASAFTSGNAQMLTPGVPLIADRFMVSLDLAAAFTVGNIIFYSSVAACITSAIGNVWGRRPVYIITTIILAGSNLGSFVARSFPLLAVTRAIAGIASGPLLTTVPATIADVFYVHERGGFLALWNVGVIVGGLLGQALAGYLIDALGFESVFSGSTIIYTVFLPLMFFLGLETLYKRPSRAAAALPAVDIGKQDVQTSVQEIVEVQSIHEQPKKSYMRQLAIFQGRITDEPFWKALYKPLVLIVSPINVYSSLIYSVWLTMPTLLGVISATALSLEPYNLSPTQVGLTNVPLLIATLIGGAMSGWSSDFIVKFMARRNAGTFEPEFRLVLFMIAMPIGAVSLFGYGSSLQKTLPLAYPVGYMTAFNFASTFALQGTLTYLVDCYPAQAAQRSASLNLVTSVSVSLSASYINGWFESSGPMVVFSVLGVITAAVTALTIPQYIFGKRIRTKAAGISWM